MLTLEEFFNLVNARGKMEEPVEVLITLEEAGEILLKYHDYGRPLSDRWVVRWANAINNGEFDNEKGQLAFDAKRNLLDGAHRLAGFMGSDKQTLIFKILVLEII